METQKTKQGFREAQMLQSQTDSLRSELQAMSRFGIFDKTWEEKHKLLAKLDKLFSLQCETHGLTLSKFGRLL